MKLPDTNPCSYCGEPVKCILDGEDSWAAQKYVGPVYITDVNGEIVRFSPHLEPIWIRHKDFCKSQMRMSILLH